jgi:phosphoesterase RecJ-like protein
MKIQDIQAIQLLLSTKKIAIIPHRGPDGDAMGSTLGLYHFLLKNNHEPIVIALMNFLISLGLAQRPLKYSKRQRKLHRNTGAVDLIFTLDNALHRVGGLF